MSLVAYGDSDDSEDDSYQDLVSDEIAENANDPAKEQRIAVSESAVVSAFKDAEEPANSQRLFARLPPPKQNASTLHDPSLQEVVIKPADKSAKSKRAQILIPSLNQFDDEEEEESKRKKFRPAQTGSGLIGMLPAPKHGSITQKQLTPQAVARPPAPKPVPKRPPPRPQVPKVPPQTSHAWDHDVDDDVDASDETPNFFTFDEPPLPKVSIDVELNASAPPPPAMSVAPVPSPPLSLSSEPGNSLGMDTCPGPVMQPAAAESRKGKIVFAEPEDRGASILDVELDDGALVRLRGKRQEEINIIDVCADNQIDKSQILIRGLTEQPTYSNHKDTSDFNTSQQHRRKHQITYLAQQAKAREQDLKNTWAQNRMTRRQTQAKYGF